jgi:hypothetical protein
MQQMKLFQHSWRKMLKQRCLLGRQKWHRMMFLHKEMFLQLLLWKHKMPFPLRQQIPKCQ